MIYEYLLITMVRFTTDDLEYWRRRMELQRNILNHFNRRKIKYLAVYAMGLAGLTIAVMALVFSQDQGAILSEISTVLSQSPVGVVFTSIKSLF